jgi:hypothetical protein
MLRHESGGRDYCANVLEGRPHWPGYGSGITIGFGWDLGHHTRTELARIWRPHPGVTAKDRLAAAAGLRAVEAGRVTAVRCLKALRRALADVGMAWEIAGAVLHGVTLPANVAPTERVLPDTDELPDDCFGALTSLVFNRDAAGFDNPAPCFTEMRAIETCMEEQAFDRIPQLLRGMKRLGPRALACKHGEERESALRVRPRSRSGAGHPRSGYDLSLIHI